MKSTGMTRPLDKLGRVVIPKEIRRNFKIDVGDTVEFFVENNSIVIRKYEEEDKEIEELVDIIKDAKKKNLFKDWPSEYLDKIEKIVQKTKTI